MRTTVLAIVYGAYYKHDSASKKIDAHREASFDTVPFRAASCCVETTLWTPGVGIGFGPKKTMLFVFARFVRGWKTILYS